MKALFVVLISTLFLIACDKEVPQGPNFIDPNPDDVEIRVENKSNFTLDSLYLNTSGGDHLYPGLTPKQTGPYRSFQYAYPELEIRFKIAGKHFYHLPANYEQMEKKESGKYNLEIASVDTNTLSFTFVLDKQ